MKINKLAAQLKKPTGKEGIEVADFMNKGNAYTNQLVFDLAEPKARQKVLEIGPGNGKLIPAYLKEKKSVKYFGLDYSEDMVEQAIRYNKKLISKGQVSIIHGSFESIPFEEKSFDQVFSINTIYFLDDPMDGLKEVFRVLKNGGKVVMGMRPKGLPQLENFSNYGFTFYTEEEINSLFKNAGFTGIITLVKNDPPVDFQGQIMNMKSLVVIAEKP